ncbi:hypothetical protein TorRG33x02_285690, partial [Trema orientale]
MSRYAPKMIASETLKCAKFEKGLGLRIFSMVPSTVDQTTKYEAHLERNHGVYKKKEEKKNRKPPLPGKTSDIVNTGGRSVGKSRFMPYSSKCFVYNQMGLKREIILAVNSQ